MSKIFISYRRNDASAVAGRIFERLTEEFGRDNVFMDIDAIPFGADFHSYLNDAINRARIVLVLIGHHWAEVMDKGEHRRLDAVDDFVRIEVEAALKRNKAVVPVLIGGAPFPRAEELPESLQPLLWRQATSVNTGRNFYIHMDDLIGDLLRYTDKEAHSNESGM